MNSGTWSDIVMTLSESERSSAFMRFPETYHSDFIESQYQQWQQDPESVSKDWQFFFKGFDLAFSSGITPAMADTEGQPSFLADVEQLIFGYRCLGHMLSCMDPLQACPMDHPLLSLERFGLAVRISTDTCLRPASWVVAGI